uniref:Ubiquitin n=1 Tax=Meloidogyne floridensis TaxID=298350 RepID=A0A915NKN3_9BILA
MFSTKFICVVCSEPLTYKNMYSISCGHVFHIDCIKNWIFQKNYCPKCWKNAVLNDIRQIFLEEVSPGYSGNVQNKSESNTIKLNVLEISGKITVLNKVKSRDSIELIKCMIQMKTGIPPDQQRLIYMGKQLIDGCLIANYDIKDGSTIHVVMRLK